MQLQTYRLLLGAAFTSLGISEAAAQSTGLGLPLELSSQALEVGLEAIDNVPNQLSEFLERASEGGKYRNEEECLSALQMTMNVATLASSLLPFSETWELEDERGLVGRVRMVINGDKIHLDAYCQGATLVGKPLPWGVGVGEPRQVVQTSLDAFLGGILLQELQGTFDVIPIVANRIDERDPVASAVEDEFRAAEDEAVPWEQRVAAKVSQCYSVQSNALSTEVDVEVHLSPIGMPSAVELIAISEDGQSAEMAYQALRRAIIRCGAAMYPLPNDATEGELSVKLRASDGIIKPIE